MSDTEQTSRVNDKRRFDMDGNIRDEEAETPGNAAENAQPSVSAESAAEPRPSAEELQRLQDELSAARRRVDELARAYQALTKEREEFKQRLSRERERLIDVEKGNVAVTLLEAIDELDRSLSAAPNDTSPLAQGVRLIRDGLLAKATATGIERLEVMNKEYDPNLAEATDMELTANADDDQKVLAEVRAGYRYKDRVIRPARVKVAKYVKPADA
jgi:molecular chaperone GrpE